jgi:Flp pilus assembly pilin Flp
MLWENISEVLSDRSGAVLVEYALFLSFVSIGAFVFVFAFAANISTQIPAQITTINSYAVNPHNYECSAGLVSSC